MTNKATDVIKVLAINIGAITITVANIKDALTIVSLLIAISYTVWKWGKDIKKKNYE